MIISYRNTNGVTFTFIPRFHISGSGVCFPPEATNFSDRTWLTPPQPFTRFLVGILPLEVNRPATATEHVSPSNAELIYEWSFTSMACTKTIMPY